MEFRRFGPAPLKATAVAPAFPVITALPAWTVGLAPSEPASAAYASPSDMGEIGKGPAPSPLARERGLGRFRRGTLIHRLLQLLPDLPPELREDAAERLLAKEGDLDPAQRRDMADAALAVLRDPQFAEVFGPGSRAEAAVAGTAPGLPDGLAVSGRVDRMLVTPSRVLVVDFKTNRPAPARIEDADRAYLIQMAIYVEVLRAVFPGRAVEAALVWTDGPRLMPVPEAVIADRLAGLSGAVD